MLPAAHPVTTFLLSSGLHRQYKSPADLYFSKLPRYTFYTLHFPVHFIFPDVPDMRRRRRALNAAAESRLTRNSGRVALTGRSSAIAGLRFATVGDSFS